MRRCRDGMAGDVPETGETHVGVLACEDVMDTGGISGGDEIAGLRGDAAAGQPVQGEGERGTQAAG